MHAAKLLPIFVNTPNAKQINTPAVPKPSAVRTNEYTFSALKAKQNCKEKSCSR